MIFYPWRPTMLAMSYNVPGLPNPQSWARHLRLCPSANAVTGQGLGAVTSEARNGAGNPVLCDGRPRGGWEGLAVTSKNLTNNVLC